MLIFRHYQSRSQSKETPTQFQGTKVEWLLGCTVEQMSYKKALEVLGISEAMMEEERAKILGNLGVKAWGNPAISTGMVDQDWNAGLCGPLFRKRPHRQEEGFAASRMCNVTHSTAEV